MFYLIGVRHEVQSISVGCEETTDHTAFRLCLEQTIQEYEPAFVAEEYSEDALSMSALRRNRPQEFFTRKVAMSRNVKHLLCDAPLKAKYSMGYQGWDGWEIQISRIGEQLSECDDLLPRALEVVKDFPLREDYWLNQLRDVLQNGSCLRLWLCTSRYIRKSIEEQRNTESNRGAANRIARRSRRGNREGTREGQNVYRTERTIHRRCFSEDSLPELWRDSGSV